MQNASFFSNFGINNILFLKKINYRVRYAANHNFITTIIVMAVMAFRGVKHKSTCIITIKSLIEDASFAENGMP